MDTSSRHLLVDVWLAEPLTDELMHGLLERARAELHVVREVEHRFEPHGLTALFVLAESHFAVHTYPEADYMSLDVYVCNPTMDVEGVADRLLAPLNIRHQRRQCLRRGVDETALWPVPRVAGINTRG